MVAVFIPFTIFSRNSLSGWKFSMFSRLLKFLPHDYRTQTNCSRSLTLITTRITSKYTSLRVQWSGVPVPVGAGNFSLHHRAQTGSGAHPASYPMGTRGSFLGVKRPERKADHSPPSSAKVKVCVGIYLHSPIRLHDVVLSSSTGTTLPLPFTLFERKWRMRERRNTKR
jgi:hypothetical protein